MEIVSEENTHINTFCFKISKYMICTLFMLIFNMNIFRENE